LIKDLRPADDDLKTFSNHAGPTEETFAIGRSQGIDFELDGEDLIILWHRGVSSIAGRVIRHRGHDACVDEPVLLAVTFLDGHPRLKGSAPDHLRFKPAVLDESPRVILCKKIHSFLG
jgi:hypothetical protein